MTLSTDVEKAVSVDTKPTRAAVAADASGRGLDDPESPSSDEVAGQAEEEFHYPDGGLVAWTQVLAGHCTNAMSWGYPATFGVYQLYYRDTLHLPESQISWIGSVQLFLAFALCSTSGRLADAGYPRATLAAGSFFAIFGTFMTSVATEYWQFFLAQGVCTGIGLGLLFMPALQVVSSYFKERRSLALAIQATGTGTGSVVFPATVQYLIPRIGFPWAVRCSAFIALFICLTATVILKPRLAPRRSGPWIEWSAYNEMPYLLYSLGAFLFFWSLYFGFFYVNAYARNIIGFSTTDSVQLLLITNGMSVPSRPVVGYLADRLVGPINMYICGTMLLGTMMFAWIGVTTRTGMYVFAVFFGLSNGAAQGVFVGSLASLTKDPRKMGTRFGMVCTMASVATVAGPPAAGAIIDRNGGSYLGAQIATGVMIVAASFVFMAARISSSGFRWKVKI